MTSATPDSSPTRFGFLLLPDFTLISMSAAVEALRMANRIAAEDVYSWQTLSIDGEAVTASDGLTVNADRSVSAEGGTSHLDAVVVCAGLDAARQASDEAISFLRQAARNGLHVGAVDTGSRLLAMAGLLDGYRCSVHWEDIATLSEAYPDAQVSRGLFTVDRDRFTSAGGTAPLDMMLSFVRRRCGADVSAGIAEQFAYERVRKADELQRVPLRHFVGKQSSKLITAVELMEANIHEPISQLELAGYVDLSLRQLQRLFQKYLFCTPSRYYLQLRLQRARELLHQTQMNLVEVSEQAGFASSSHFSKSYKEYFGYSPSEDRRGDA